MRNDRIIAVAVVELSRDFGQHRPRTGAAKMVACGQHLITRTAYADEFLADFLYSLPVGPERKRRRRKHEQQNSLTKPSLQFLSVPLWIRFRDVFGERPSCSVAAQSAYPPPGQCRRSIPTSSRDYRKPE